MLTYLLSKYDKLTEAVQAQRNTQKANVLLPHFPIDVDWN